MAVSQSELDIIIKAVAEGQGITQINRQLDELKTKAAGASGFRVAVIFP